MSDHASTQELINKIESKDRRFRTAQAAFMLLLLAALVGIVFVQFRTLESVHQQLVVSRTVAAETKSQSNAQNAIIIHRLDCMTAFFSVPNRTNLTISDVEKCSISGNDPQQYFTPNNGTTTQKNTDGSTTTTTNDTPGNPGSSTGPTSQAPQNQAPTVPPVQKSPVRVFGIPVCIPFTGVCVR
jgi:hypothetical protein